MRPVNQQLLLDLGLPVEPTLANFVPGRNAPLMFLLESLAAGGRNERHLHIWGSQGSGKSHLLRALGTLPTARYLNCQAQGALDLRFDAAVTLWCVDDVEAASAELQIGLFALVNAVRDHPESALVTAGIAAPLHLELREDLRTRLGWGPVFQVEPLDDAERAAALSGKASARGLELSDEVRNYLLTHFSRDMSSLVELIDALDRYTLERQRILTVPLIREWLQRSLPLHPVS
jgi:DnaA family protein